MGCQTSSAEEQDQTKTKHKNIPLMKNLSQNQKQQLLQIIETDNIASLALIDSQNKLCLNAEVSGDRWMMSHFCCRWDSPRCLQYLLKKVYTQQPQNYIRYVNQKTKERWTCLHICAMNRSQKCFGLILNLGGVDFAMKDREKKTAEATAKDYHCMFIAQTLKKFRKLKYRFNRVNHEDLSEEAILNEQNLNQEYKNNYKLKTDPSVLGMVTKYMNASEEKLKVLNQEKDKIEKQRDEIIRIKVSKEKERQTHKQEQKKIQVQDQNKKIEVKEKSQGQQVQVYNINTLFQEENPQLQKHHQNTEQDSALLQKEQQLIKVKSLIDEFHIQQQIEQIDQEQKKLEEIAKQTETMRKEKLELNMSKLREKSQILKNVSQSKLKSVINKAKSVMKKEIVKQIPQEFKSIYEQAQKAGQFSDQQFPPTQKSIGNQSNKDKFGNIVWMRPAQIFNGNYELFDGIDPNDIKQGSLGVCYYLATLASLAKNPENIKKLFIFQDKNVGLYVLQMYINGMPKNIVIDDKIPCKKQTKTPIFTKPVGNQIWVCLLEKCWVKMMGTYIDAEAMTPDHMMEDLSSSPSYGKWFKDQANKLQDINQQQQKEHIVVLTSSSTKKIQGISNNHAYSVLGIYNYRDQHIYKIRNPWGHFQWNGKFSQSSNNWTPQMKSMVGHAEEDDGVFFMSQWQLLEAFDYYSISLLKSQNVYSPIPFQSNFQEDLYFKFKLNSSSQLNLRVTQPFQRMVHDSKYQYSPLIFEVGKIQSDGSVKFLSQGNNSTNWGAKSVHACQNICQMYQSGEYFIRIRMLWKLPSKYNQAVLSCYCKQKVNIQKISQQQGIELWKELARSIMSNQQCSNIGDGLYNMKWMKGQLICYAYLDKGKQGDKGQSIFTFDLNTLQNCKLSLSAVDDKVLKMPIGYGRKNAGIGTVCKLCISSGCTTGQLSIKINKK